jgi:hypothetical protein
MEDKAFTVYEDRSLCLSVCLSWSVFRWVIIVAKSACKLCHVRPPDHIYQHGSDGTGFSWIWLWEILGKCVGKRKIWVKLDKYIGHFTWRYKDVYIVVSRMGKRNHQLRSGLLTWVRVSGERRPFSFMSVCLSAFLRLLRKYVEKPQIWLNSDKYIGQNCVSRCNSDSCRSNTDSALLCFRDNALSICYSYCSQHICICALQRERIIAFPWRIWVCERAVLLCYAYTSSSSSSSFVQHELSPPEWNSS